MPRIRSVSHSVESCGICLTRTGVVFHNNINNINNNNNNNKIMTIVTPITIIYDNYDDD